MYIVSKYNIGNKCILYREIFFFQPYVLQNISINRIYNFIIALFLYFTFYDNIYMLKHILLHEHNLSSCNNDDQDFDSKRI